jgi:hypothetical protein
MLTIDRNFHIDKPLNVLMMVVMFLDDIQITKEQHPKQMQQTMEKLVVEFLVTMNVFVHNVQNQR